MTKRVLTAIAEVLPDDGHAYLAKVDIRRGWGNVLNVRLHTTMRPTEAGRELGERLRDAVDQALEDERHLVEIVWSAGR
jgi:tryptophan synthase beta subunit